MPTYDYQCEGCGHAFEEFQAMSDKPLKKCPKCKKTKLRRLFGTGAAVIFKGSGFYQTDYRSESYKAAAKADQQPAAQSAPAEKSSAKDSPAPTAKDKPATQTAEG
jgi:putative FmdB family regulatory protein